MPNFKIFQDNPDKARIKIFGNQNVALNTDAIGNLGITSTGLAVTAPANGLLVTAPATGLAITPPADGLLITSTGLAVTAPANGLLVTAAGLSITPPADGLLITSTGLAVTAPANGLLVTAPATGLAITPPSGGLLITSTGLAVLTNLVTADISEQVATNNTTGLPSTARDVLGYRTWSFAVVNASTTIAPATVKLQISPDGTNWMDEGSVVTLNDGELTALVSSIFLRYARVFYAAVDAASTVTLNIYFQAQS